MILLQCPQKRLTTLAAPPVVAEYAAASPEAADNSAVPPRGGKAPCHHLALASAGEGSLLLLHLIL